MLIYICFSNVVSHNSNRANVGRYRNKDIISFDLRSLTFSANRGIDMLNITQVNIN